MSKSIRSIVLSVLALSLLPTSIPAQVAQSTGVTSSTNNPLQIAILHWYDANLTTTFAVGSVPASAAFDGANIWVANEGSNTVTKLRANDGEVVGTFSAGGSPSFLAFDGANIWVTNGGRGSDTVTKLRASDGKIRTRPQVRPSVWHWGEALLVWPCPTLGEVERTIIPMVS